MNDAHRTKLRGTRASRGAGEKGQSVRRPGEVRRVAVALNRFTRAQDAAAARGADLLAVAGTLQTVAIAQRDETLVCSLLERQLPRDILALRNILAKSPPGSLPEELEALRLLPDALVQWMGEQFGLAPDGTVGEEIELPAARLAQFDCAPGISADLADLVRVRVVASGWKRFGRTLVPASVKATDEGKDMPL
jgi:hypothetical protein